jgi:4-hydroxybenzoate polyprenyltransferase/phosphoserine phosphatase
MASVSVIAESPGYSQEQVICVDLDGTLIRTDLLAESLLAALRSNVLIAVFVPFWLLRGKAFLKAKLAEYLALKASTLPYNDGLIEYLRNKRQNGSRLYLTTAAHISFAEAVAEHLGMFDGILASDGVSNNRGEEKVRRIQKLLGGRDFVYAADAPEDIAVWKRSQGAITVGVKASVRKSLAQQSVPIEKAFDKPKHRLKSWVKALRLYQWSKNVIIFLPLFLSHHLEPFRVLHSINAFFAFSFCASMFYLVNDLLDVEADRSHPRKRKRPFAAGDLSIAQGAVGVLACAAVVIALTALLPFEARILVAVYATINLLYSTYLKRTLFLDVLVLAALYTLRLLLGGAAEGIQLSIWTLAFSIFLFLGLALVKRLAELITAAGQNSERLARRAYTTADLSSIRSFATTSLYMSTLVLALYMNSADVLTLYKHPQFLWCVCLLLIYWVSRVMLIANRGLMSDDPVIFALKDQSSRVVAVLVAICVLLAL